MLLWEIWIRFLCLSSKLLSNAVLPNLYFPKGTLYKIENGVKACRALQNFWTPFEKFGISLLMSDSSVYLIYALQLRVSFIFILLGPPSQDSRVGSLFVGSNPGGSQSRWVLFLFTDRLVTNDPNISHKSRASLELHSRAAPSVEAHHGVNSLDTRRKFGRKADKKKQFYGNL